MTKRKRSAALDTSSQTTTTTTLTTQPTKKQRLNEPTEDKHRSSLLSFVDKFEKDNDDDTVQNAHLIKALECRNAARSQVLRILVYGKQGQGKSHTLNVITVGTPDGPLPYGQTMTSVTSAPIYIKPRCDNSVLVLLDMMTMEEAMEYTLNLKKEEIEQVLQANNNKYFQRDASFTWESVRNHLCSFDNKTLACVKQIRLEFAYYGIHDPHLIDFPGEGHSNKYVKPEFLKKQRMQAMQDANAFFYVDARTPTEENYKKLIEESEQSLFQKALIQIFRQDAPSNNSQTLDQCNASSITILESLAYNSLFLPNMTPRAKLECFNTLMNTLRTEPSYKFTDKQFVFELCYLLKEHIVSNKVKDYISAMSVFVYLTHGVEKQQLKYHQKLVKSMCTRIAKKFGFKPTANNVIDKQTKGTITTFLQQNNGKVLSVKVSMLKDLFQPCFQMVAKYFEEKLNSNIAIYAKNMVYKRSTKNGIYIKFEQLDTREFDEAELNEYHVVRSIVLDDFATKKQDVMAEFVVKFKPMNCTRTEKTIKVKLPHPSAKQDVIEQTSNDWSLYAFNLLSNLFEVACKKAWENLSNNMALKDAQVDSDSDDESEVIKTTTTMQQWKQLLKSNYKTVHQIERFRMPIFTSNDRYAYTIEPNQVCDDMLKFSHLNREAVKCTSHVHVEYSQDMPANLVTFRQHKDIHAMMKMSTVTYQRVESYAHKVNCMFNASSTEQTMVLAPILVIVNSMQCFEHGKLSKSEFDGKPHLLMLAVEAKNEQACMHAHPNAIIMSFPNNYLHPITVLDCVKLFMEKLNCPIYFHVGQNVSYFSELCVQSMKARECSAARAIQFLQSNLHKVVYNAKQRMQALVSNNENAYRDKALDAIAARTCGKEVLTRFLDLQKKLMGYSPQEIEECIAKLMDCDEKTQIASLQAKLMLASVTVDSAKYVIPTTLANFPNIYKVTPTTLRSNVSLHMTDAQRGACYSGEGKIVWQTNKMEYKNFNKELLKVQQCFANKLNVASMFCYGFSVRNSEYTKVSKK